VGSLVLSSHRRIPWIRSWWEKLTYVGSHCGAKQGSGVGGAPHATQKVISFGPFHSSFFSHNPALPLIPIHPLPNTSHSSLSLRALAFIHSHQWRRLNPFAWRVGRISKKSLAAMLTAKLSSTGTTLNGSSLGSKTSRTATSP